jgi:predicted ATPase
MLARLERRLPLLTGGARDLPARQRTLRDTIAWSYGLLDEEDRRVFRLLGIFAGGCTLDAVEALADNPTGELFVLDHLDSLVDKNLFQQVTVRGEPRFTMLETIREFALDQLEAPGEATAIRRRHVDFFVHLAERADPHLISREQVEWLNLLEEEHGNLTAALAWSRDAQERDDRTARGVPAALAGLRLAGALHWLWWLGGRVGEGRSWLAEVLTWDVGEAGRPARSRALFAAGTMYQCWARITRRIACWTRAPPWPSR